jgi:hypothetical protein
MTADREREMLDDSQLSYYERTGQYPAGWSAADFRRVIARQARMANVPQRGKGECEEAYGYLLRNVIEPNGLLPLPTLMGICTQVDNLVAGMKRRAWPEELSHEVSQAFFREFYTHEKHFDLTAIYSAMRSAHLRAGKGE